MQRGGGLAGIHASGVEIGHAHAAQADGGNLRAVFAQLTCLHEINSLWCERTVSTSTETR